MDSRIPISLITGFLGAGKTTTLNHLLGQHAWPERSVIIVNDFGAIAIDDRLIASNADRIIVFENGCICCTLQGDLAEGILAFLEEPPYPEHIIMETSGVTSVANVMRVMSQPELHAGVVIAQRIVVLDASRFLKTFRAFPVVAEQVEHADMVVMNRCDEVGRGEIEKVRQAVERLQTGARIIETEFGRLDPQMVGSTAFRGVEVGSDMSGHEHQHWHTYRIVFHSAPPLESLEDALGKLRMLVERAKGFIATRKGPRHVDITGGRSRIEEAEGLSDVASGRDSTLVIISEKPCGDSLREAFDAIGNCEIRKDH